ncbi:eCIS core domain-containing protein [Bradyrhizobium iriomotense]|nr:DUF4157 domain-containing protein [Bradyrhizobium iriomotense]
MAPPIVHDVLRSPGQPLDAATRSFMEPRFGHDFGDVRIHSDHAAAESARAVGACAYTVGQAIAFADGEYRPGADSGRRLLAHELAHTLQQAGAAPSVIQRQPGADTAPEGTDFSTAPRYIDNIFESVQFFGLNGATAFYWTENGTERKIVVPLTDLRQDESLINVPIWKLHKSKVEAEKTVQDWAKADPNFDYYTFYTGDFGVIMPTSFSKTSMPHYHDLWPALRKDFGEKIEDIRKGMQSLANAVNPVPCTEVDEDGSLTVNPSFGNCALPILLHAAPHIAKGGRGGKGGASPPAGETPKASEQAPAHPDTAPKEPAGAKPSEIAEAVAANEIDAKQLAAEVDELRKDAGDPAKVHQPADPSSPYDAEMATSDGHEFHRDKESQLWERCSPRPCKKGLKVDAQTNKKVDAAVKTKAKPSTAKSSTAKSAPKSAPKTKTTPPRAGTDVITSGNEPLKPGKSDLGQYGIDEYGTYSNRPGDKFAGHEMLQNLWLEVKGYGERLKTAASRKNPAVALSHDEHVAVGREQRDLGLFDRDKLAKMSAEEVIKQNALAMRRAGIPEDVIAILEREALRYAATLKPPGK